MDIVRIGRQIGRQVPENLGENRSRERTDDPLRDGCKRHLILEVKLISSIPRVFEKSLGSERIPGVHEDRVDICRSGAIFEIQAKDPGEIGHHPRGSPRPLRHPRPTDLVSLEVGCIGAHEVAGPPRNTEPAHLIVGDKETGAVAHEEVQQETQKDAPGIHILASPSPRRRYLFDAIESLIGEREEP